MLRSLFPRTRARAANLLLALLAMAPLTGLAWAQDKAPGPMTPDAISVVPPNAIAMPTEAPTFDSQRAPASTPMPAPLAAPALPTPPAAVVASPIPEPLPAGTPPTAPAFSLATEIEQRLARDRSTIAADRADRDAAEQFYAARKGEPLWVTAKGPTVNAKALATEIAAADAYALDAKAFRLPSLGSETQDPANTEVELTLAALKYARHARGGRTDPAQLSANFDRKPQVLSPASVLAGLAASDAPSVYLAGLNPQAKQFQLLKAKLADVRAGRQQATTLDAATAAPTPPTKAKTKSKAAPQPKELTGAQIERKIIANMEMWRWMPDLGNYYIQSNIPEYQFRVVRDGKEIHSERLIVGKVENQTPLFSETMKLVVFQPFWNVPNSIKVKELLPQLARNRGALAKAGLKANYGNREVDPTTVDFSVVDIRNLHIFQPPGPANALGKVKFLFPNKHDVYMHDTPTKPLFNASVRAFSHGCMRVRDPVRLAELLLSVDKGWDRKRIDGIINGGQPNQEIRLTQPVPVHVTYFTAWVDPAGNLKLVNDIYNHESKVQLGLEGKAHLIPKPTVEKPTPGLLERRPVQLAPRGSGADDGNWMKKLFSF